MVSSFEGMGDSDDLHLTWKAKISSGFDVKKAFVNYLQAVIVL
jgi:hypothetical protein